MLGRPLVPYPYGIRRRQQHLKKASGRGWGLEGKPSGQRATRQLRLPSSLGFRRRSRRLPHPVGSDLRQVRPLRAGSALVRRCSRARRPGLSLGPVLVDLSAWDPSWTSARGFRRSRRCSGCGSGGRGVHPGSSAGACRAAWHTPPGTRPPKRADRPYARSPRRSTCFPSRPSLRTASARAHRTGRSSHADAGAAHAACCSDCNPGTGPGERHSKEPARRRRSGRRGS